MKRRNSRHLMGVESEEKKKEIWELCEKPKGESYSVIIQ